MKYERTCSQDSFRMSGSGFHYHYESNSNLINITLQDTGRAIAQLRLDRYLAKQPSTYVETLNKTHQIKALMFSNNATINMSDTMGSDHISSLIKTTARISRSAYDLDTKNFKRFCGFFSKEFDLNQVKVKKFFSKQKNQNIYLARIKTQNNNSISARACNLSQLAQILSEKTLTDLITMEVGHNYNDSAQKLLNLSSKLSTIGHILDENFIPEHKLNQYSEFNQSSKSVF